MQKNQKNYKQLIDIFVKVVAVLILFSLALPQDSLKEVFAAASDESVNYIFLDVTYNPETMTYSISGLSDAQLSQLGAPKLQAAIWNILGRFESVGLEIDQSLLNLKTNDANLATINWDEESREMLFNLIDSYGLRMTAASKQRTESWLNTIHVVLNVRNSPELSKPLIIDLATLLRVDISDQGRVAVEGFDLGFALQPSITDLVAAGGINNASICWSKGMLNSEVNGTTLPQITVHQDGVEVIDKALGLNLGQLEQYFQSQIGASVSFFGSEHINTECGE